VFASLATSAPAGVCADVANTAFGSPDVLVLEGSYQESEPYPAT
jgi:hypothetical protein